MITKAMPSEGPVLNMTSLTGAGSPAVLRILLGAQLRRLREAKRITLEEAGYVIRASHSKVSRLESGRVAFKDRDIVDLFIHYGVTDQAQIQTLREVAARANSRGWWHDYSDVLPGWFEEYISLERPPSRSAGTRCSSYRGCCRRKNTPAPSHCSLTRIPRRSAAGSA